MLFLLVPLNLPRRERIGTVVSLANDLITLLSNTAVFSKFRSLKIRFLNLNESEKSDC